MSPSLRDLKCTSMSYSTYDIDLNLCYGKMDNNSGNLEEYFYKIAQLVMLAFKKFKTRKPVCVGSGDIVHQLVCGSV